MPPPIQVEVQTPWQEQGTKWAASKKAIKIPAVPQLSDSNPMTNPHKIRASCEEVMEIGIHKVITGNLHPIIIITWTDSEERRVATKALLIKCCTDKGLISQDLFNTLGHPTSMGDTRTFATAASTFSMNKILQINGAMHPCLSSNQTFAIELMVVPQGCSAEQLWCIIGQDTIQALNLDTNVQDNTISWREDKFQWFIKITGLRRGFSNRRPTSSNNWNPNPKKLQSMKSSSPKH